MAYYWVNQGKSFDYAVQSGTLWAPDHTTSDKTAHLIVAELLPGDIVFSYVNQHIVAISYVTHAPITALPAPEMSRGGLWAGRPGNLVRAVYEELEHPINIPKFRALLEPLMPTVRSPLTRYWKGNQGYMYAISPTLGRTLLELAQLTHTDVIPYAPPAGDPFTEGVVLSGQSLGPELRQSRTGRGAFRNHVLNLWGNQCSVTCFNYQPLLYASHIKPWADSNNAERVDPHNGLLLTPSLHATFHRGLITFAEDGEIIISEALTPMHLTTLGVLPGMQLRSHPGETSQYLAHHREHVFQDGLGELAYRGGYS